MASAQNDYKSSVRWFLEKPWRGNTPTGPVRAQLSSLQASLVRLFQDCVASKDEELVKLAGQLLVQYNAVFQEEASKSMIEFADSLSDIQKILNKFEPTDWLPAVRASLKHAVVQLIDLAITRQDEVLARKLLDFVRELAPRVAEVPA